MIKKLVLFVSLTGVFLCTASCGHKELPSMGDYSVQVFNETHVRFARMYIPPLLTLRDRTVSIIW